MGYKYSEFIKNFSGIYKKGFVVFVAVLAAIFINIYTSKLNLDISDTFNVIIVLLFVTLAIVAILISLICSAILFFIIVYGFGSVLFVVQVISNKIYDKWGLLITIIIDFIVLSIGIYLSFSFNYPSLFLLFGLFLELLAIIPFAYTLSNKITKHKAVPAYIG